MWSRCEGKGVTAALLALVQLTLSCAPAAAQLRVYSSNQVVASWLWHIGGICVEVRSAPPRGSSDAFRFELTPRAEGRAQGAVVYLASPPKGVKETELLFDPASAPFLWNKIVRELSRLDPKNQPYYQRRLSELYSRWTGLIGMGRRMLAGYPPVLDLSESVGSLLKNMGLKVEQPSGDKPLEEEIAKASSEGKVVLISSWTDPSIQRLVLDLNSSGKARVWNFQLKLDEKNPDFLLMLLDNLRSAPRR